jgi:hypothetical protein
MVKSKHCDRCHNPRRKVLWLLLPKRKLCNTCYDYVMENEDVNIDNIRRLSDRDEDFGEFRDNGRRQTCTLTAAKAV